MLCDLPPEIIIQIFSRLSPNDLSSCKAINKYLHNIIEESHVLQYRAALILARAEDNPCSNRLVIDKLKALQSAEKAWSHVQPQFTTTVPVTHQQSGVYDLTGGVYLLSNSTRTALHYIKLPTTKEDVVQWKWMLFTKTIIDIGLCLFEHDLIVIVTTTPRSQPNSLPTTYDIELQYLEFSTGRPHPRARKSSVLVMNSPWQKPAVGIEIVGDHLVLILSFNNGQRPDDRVYIYDWINDVLKMSSLVPYRSYSGLIFLTEHLILIPNVRTNALDIFRIPEKPIVDTPVPVLVLHLPELAEERLMGGISCRAEPNPIGAASSLFARRESREREGTITDTVPDRGFLASAEDAICIFEMRILVLRLNLLQGGWNINFQPRDRFSFIVHRDAFVNLVELHGKKDGEEKTDLPGSDVQTSPVEQQEPVISSPPSGTTTNGTQAEGEIEAEAGTGPGTVTETTENPPSESQGGTPSIPWAEWGPPVTRWFNSDDVSTRWITISAGQRCVRMQDNPPPSGFPFTILDFNPTNIAKMKREQDLRLKGSMRGDEKDSATKKASENSAVDDSAMPITETHYEIPGSLGPDTPVHMGSSLDNADIQDFLESRQDPSSSGTNSVSVVENVGPVGEADEAQDMHNEDEEDDEENNPGGHSTIYLPSGYHLDDLMEGDEDDEFEEDEGDDLSDFAYEDAEMVLLDDEDEEDNESEENNDYGTVDFTGFADDPDNAPLPNDFAGGRERERIRVVTSFDQVEPADAFAEPVRSELPYVACDSEERYVFDGVLLDEERVIGVRTDENDRIEKVEILYFG